MQNLIKITIATGVLSGLMAFAPSPRGLELDSSAEALAQQDGPTALQEAMGVFKTGQRALRKLIDDPKANQDVLMKTLGEMEAATITALGETPKVPEGVDRAGVPLWKVSYKQAMNTLLGSILDMQAATLKGDATALKAGYDLLGATKKSGHENFRAR